MQFKTLKRPVILGSALMALMMVIIVCGTAATPMPEAVPTTAAPTPEPIAAAPATEPTAAEPAAPTPEPTAAATTPAPAATEPAAAAMPGEGVEGPTSPGYLEYQVLQ